MKINVGLVGKGNWGRKIENKLIKLSNLKFVCGKKNKLISDIKKNNIKWVFVASPNDTHYDIVKKCIQNKINVFCEKPLCLSYHKAKKLIELKKKYKVKLFVSDLYAFYSNKIRILVKKNYVFRSKFVNGDDNEYLFRLMYHDISILYNFLKSNKILKIVKNENINKKIFKVEIFFKKKIFYFEYNLNIKQKRHHINKLKIKTGKDLLGIMIKNVLLKKIDFNKNNIKALFIIKFLNKIEKLN